jgi:hypothetical protein
LGYSLGETGSDDLSTFDAELIRCKIQDCQRPHILWIAVNMNSSTSGQMGMIMVPKLLLCTVPHWQESTRKRERQLLSYTYYHMSSYTKKEERVQL